jgi:small subunit ribosomal protein S8
MFSDPISDFLCRVRNAARAQHADLVMPHSRIKEGVALVLKQEGYVSEVSVEGAAPKKNLRVKLKYAGKKSVIEGLRRMSSPGRRVYAACTEIPKVRGGLGVIVLSTPVGVITDRDARKRNVGGELLFSVW